MALDDTQEAALKAEVEALKEAIEKEKVSKAFELKANEETKKATAVKETTKKEINADYAKSISELQQKVTELEAKLGTGTKSGLRPVLKWD